MELFKRFPTFRLLPNDEILVPLKERSNYPSFAADFEILDKELMPYFRKLDNDALQQQNQYRWMYVILIFGGSIVTILGVTQLAFRGIPWMGIAGAIIAAILGMVTAASQTFKYHERYMNARLAAERLRSEYFLFLGRYDQYKNDQDRVEKLLQRITELKIGGERDGAV